MKLGAASLIFRYGDSFDVANDLGAYERLPHDCMLGDHTLFTRAVAPNRRHLPYVET